MTSETFCKKYPTLANDTLTLEAQTLTSTPSTDHTNQSITAITGHLTDIHDATSDHNIQALLTHPSINQILSWPTKYHYSHIQNHKEAGITHAHLNAHKQLTAFVSLTASSKAMHNQQEPIVWVLAVAMHAWHK